MKLIAFTALLFLIFACEQEADESVSNEENATTEKTKKPAAYTFKAIYKEDIGWGYQIYRGAKILINQEHIPAVNGLYGFETREKAEIAATFIVSQMEDGNERPTVKAQELDSIGAINLDSLNTISLEKMP